MKRAKHPKTVPLTRPTLEAFDAYAPLFKKSIESGMLTTNVHGAEFEKRLAAYLGVKHCVVVSSCTSGLMLAVKGLGLTGEVIIPSFTFCATGLPVIWNGLTPVFADVDPDTYTLSPESVEKCITPKTSAIIATHVFGVTCDVRALEALARKHNLKLIFDAAHAFGSEYEGVRAGNFGDVEVFSCSPTKILTTGEGGIIATNNDALAQFCRLGRNYGDDGTNNILFAGLNARQSEFHAAIGLRSLAKFGTNLKTRIRKGSYLKKELRKIEPRLAFQHIPENRTMNYKDLSVRIEPEVLGYTRDELHAYFAEQGINARKYFYPPLHAQDAYKKFAPKQKGALPVTNLLVERVMSLPLYTHMSKEEMDRVLTVFSDWTKARKA